MIGNSVMRTLRFSRTVKHEVQGHGLSIALVLEIRVPADYPVNAASIELKPKKDGSGMQIVLAPEPKVCEIVEASATQIEITAPATATECIDMDAFLQAEEANAEARAVELLLPEQVKEPSFAGKLLASGNVTPFALGMTSADIKHQMRVADKKARRLAAARAQQG